MLVFFVDYGTLDAVDRRDIRLKTMLHDIPIQSMCCVLHGIRPAKEHTLENGMWTIEALNTLHKWIVEKEFRVQVRNVGSPLQISLKGNQKAQSIAHQLVLQQLAEFCEKKKKNYKKKK